MIERNAAGPRPCTPATWRVLRLICLKLAIKKERGERQHLDLRCQLRNIGKTVFGATGLIWERSVVPGDSYQT
jgi:hypothetical protein